MKRIWEFLLQLTQNDLDKYPGLWKITKPSGNISDAALWSGYSLFRDVPGETRSLNWRKI
jgi:hypothetical protein